MCIRDRPRIMATADQPTRPMMGGATSLEPDQAWRQLLEERQESELEAPTMLQALRIVCFFTSPHGHPRLLDALY